MSGFEGNWANTTDEVRNHYGQREVVEKFGGSTVTAGITEEAIWEFSYDALPTFSTGDMEKYLPANSLIKSSRLEVITAFAGGTSYNFGLYQGDGTVIDADGIDAAVLTAALTANAWIVNDGALVGAGVGANDAQLVVAATGTFTAGKARLIVEYIKPGS